MRICVDHCALTALTLNDSVANDILSCFVQLQPLLLLLLNFVHRFVNFLDSLYWLLYVRVLDFVEARHTFVDVAKRSLLSRIKHIRTDSAFDASNRIIDSKSHLTYLCVRHHDCSHPRTIIIFLKQNHGFTE